MGVAGGAAAGAPDVDARRSSTGKYVTDASAGLGGETFATAAGPAVPGAVQGDNGVTKGVDEAGQETEGGGRKRGRGGRDPRGWTGFVPLATRELPGVCA